MLCLWGNHFFIVVFLRYKLKLMSPSQNQLNSHSSSSNVFYALTRKSKFYSTKKLNYKVIFKFTKKFIMAQSVSLGFLAFGILALQSENIRSTAHSSIHEIKKTFPKTMGEVSDMAFIFMKRKMNG